ncbi:lipoxygenase homology domain-containing protein 1-like [Amphiura filiformis]|uniref:lipoxygenase homology domain-containing protein 1-like n=1 Tax=Amphiura filiformis TaxID=82378 RepID=UPI003B20D81F
MFQKGQVDIFTIEAIELGKVHSIQLENTSQDPKQTWFLDIATFKIMEKSEGNDKEGEKKDEEKAAEGKKQDNKLEYLCQRWIGVSDAESDELKDAESETTLLVQETMKCTVITSDLPDCGTDCQVSITISGDLGRSEVMTLDNGQTDNFQPGKTAEFELPRLPYVGSLTKLCVELTGEVSDEKAWHLKQILLEDISTGTIYPFDFNCWLSKSKEDSKGIFVERPALVQNQEPLPVIAYQLQVFTGLEEKVTTDGDVYVTINGSHGNTGKRKLYLNDNGEKPFDKSEKTDVFTIEAVSIGEPKQLAVHKEGSSHLQLNKIVLKEGQYAPKELEFQYSDWIGDNKEPIEASSIETRPSEMVEPLPEGESQPETKGKWELFITTGSEDDADTDSPVKLTVFGDKGTSDAIILGEDIPTDQKFRTGATDRFEVSIGDIGRIDKIQLEQESDKVDDWFIEKVKMVDMDTKATFSYKPRCWLDWNQGPGAEEYRDIALEIPALWPEDDKKVTKYNVKIQTSSEDNSETTANVYISLYGEKGHTGVRQLRKSDQEVLFQKGQTDLFKIEAVDLGSLQKVIIGHDGKDGAFGWLIDEITVETQQVGEDPSTGVKSYIGKNDKWLSVEAEDKLTERELMLSAQESEGSQTDKPANWKAHVTTKPDEKASTKAQIMITVYGEKRKSDELPLGKAEGDNFESGKTDEIPLHLDDLGKLYKIRLSHDNTGDDPSWYPDKVELEEIERGQKVSFPCDKWLSRDEGDGEIIREFAAVHEGEEPLPSVKYQIEIATGDDENAGTESNIYLTLYGERGDTGKRLMRIQGQDKVVFAKDATQTFTLEAVSLGAITKCIVGHDGKKHGAGMYLKKITVKESAEAKEEDLFVADRWLDASKDDKKIEVELEVYKGTVFGPDKFDKDADAKALLEAMKGAGTNEEKIISIIPHRTNKQRQELLEHYQKTQEKNLVDDLKSELKSDFEALVVGLMQTPALFDATCLKNAMEGAGTDEKALIEILCTRNNKQMKEIKNVFNSEFRSNLEESIENDTSGKFKTLLLALCTTNRDESIDIKYAQVEADAKRLYNRGDPFLGSNEEAIVEIFTSRNRCHLKTTFTEYEKLAGHSIEETIKKELDDDLQEGYLAIVKCLQNPAAFFAEKLNESMKGLGTNDTQLIRCIISRAEVDMALIKEEYNKAYGEPLEKAIKGDTGGDYEKMLLALIEGNQNQQMRRLKMLRRRRGKCLRKRR